jgi:hypothetical protein
MFVPVSIHVPESTWLKKYKQHLEAKSTKEAGVAEVVTEAPPASKISENYKENWKTVEAIRNNISAKMSEMIADETLKEYYQTYNNLVDTYVSRVSNFIENLDVIYEKLPTFMNVSGDSISLLFGTSVTSVGTDRDVLERYIVGNNFIVLSRALHLSSKDPNYKISWQNTGVLHYHKKASDPTFSEYHVFDPYVFVNAAIMTQYEFVTNLILDNQFSIERLYSVYNKLFPDTNLEDDVLLSGSFSLLVKAQEKYQTGAIKEDQLRRAVLFATAMMYSLAYIKPYLLSNPFDMLTTGAPADVSWLRLGDDLYYVKVIAFDESDHVAVISSELARAEELLQ